MRPPRLRGAYEDFYLDNFKGTPESDTHNGMLANEVLVDLGGHDLPLAQHSEYRWLSVPELLASANVHRYTQDYFRMDPSG